MKHIRTCCAAVLLVVFPPSTPQAQDTARPALKEIIAQVRRSESLISDIEARLEWRWLHHPLKRGTPLYGEPTWWFRSDWRQRLEGEFIRSGMSAMPDQPDQQPFIEYELQVFDGSRYKEYYTYPDPHFPAGVARKGIIAPDVGEIEKSGPSPKHLLGYSFVKCLPRYSTLSDLLEAGTEARVAYDTQVDGHPCIMVETLVLKTREVLLRHWRPEDITPNLIDRESRRVKVWLDPVCGHRPRRIEEYLNSYNACRRRLENIELEEVEPGIWLPVEGDDILIRSMPRSIRPGMSVLEVLELPRKERFASVAFEETPSRASKRLRVKEYKVNKGIPDEVFSLEFPEGTEVGDVFTSVMYTVGEPGSERPIASPGRNRRPATGPRAPSGGGG